MGLSVIDNIMTVDGVPEKELFPTTFKKIFQIQRRKSLLFFLCDHPRSFKLQLLHTTCVCICVCVQDRILPAEGPRARASISQLFQVDMMQMF